MNRWARVPAFLVLVAAAGCTSGSTGGSSAASGVSFEPATYRVGGGPQQAAAADLNADGEVDIATADYGSSTISILPGTGDGTFGEAAHVRSGIPHPLGVAAADMDGDDVPDLVVVGQESPRVAVLLNLGHGRFRTTTYPGADQGQGLIVADVNDDGAPDVIVADGGGGVTPFLNGGNGTLRTTGTVSTSSGMVSGLAAGDLNGDGNADIVTANSLLGHSDSEQTDSVLLGNGDGTFTRAVVYRNPGRQPTTVRLADLNGDGNLDVVTPNGCCPSNDATVFVGKGDGTLGEPTSVGVGDSPHDAALEDVNGDGIVDLLTSNLGTSMDVSAPEDQDLTVLLGVGDGTFGATTHIADPWPNSLTAADLNADGKVDLIVPNELNGTIVVLLNGG